MPTVQQTHTINADPKTVFTHLTQADKLSTWWTSKAESEPRLGGAFRYQWNFAPDAPKEDHVQQGTYTEFEAGKAVAYPWDAGGPTTVRIHLAPDGDATTLTLEHTDIPDDKEIAEMLQGGWQFFFENLGRVVRGGPDGRGQMGMIVGEAVPA